MATNAARYRMVAGQRIKLLEFGLRRAQGPDGGLSASKYAYVGEWTKNILRCCGNVKEFVDGVKTESEKLPRFRKKLSSSKH